MQLTSASTFKNNSLQSAAAAPPPPQQPPNPLLLIPPLLLLLFLLRFTGVQTFNQLTSSMLSFTIILGSFMRQQFYSFDSNSFPHAF